MNLPLNHRLQLGHLDAMRQSRREAAADAAREARDEPGCGCNCKCAGHGGDTRDE